MPQELWTPGGAHVIPTLPGDGVPVPAADRQQVTGEQITGADPIAVVHATAGKCFGQSGAMITIPGPALLQLDTAIRSLEAEVAQRGTTIARLTDDVVAAKKQIKALETKLKARR